MLLRLLLLMLLLLLPQLVHATTFYVATTGDDARSCGAAQNLSLPKQTIASGMTCLTGGGDSLLIRGGTYFGTVSTPGVSGTSWANPVWIGAYQSGGVFETVILRGTGGDHVLAVGGGGNYVIFDHLAVSAPSGQQFSIAAGGAGRVRFQYGDVFMDPFTCTAPYTSSPGYAIYINPGASETQFIGNNIHDAPCGYGLYVHASNVLIDGNRIYNNAGYGIQIYAGEGCCLDNNIVRNNEIFGNGFLHDHDAITVYYGNNNVFYNNVIYSNKRCGFSVGTGSIGHMIVNNTVYNNPGCAVEIMSGAVAIDVRNNLFYLSNGILDSGTGSTLIPNRFTNPSFVNPAAPPLGFRLQPSSDALNNGVDFSAFFSTDFEGTARGLGGGWDQGAFELASAPPPTQVVFTVQPQSTPVGQVLAPVVVQIQDASGNLVSGSSAQVTLMLATAAQPLTRTGWTIPFADSVETGYAAANVLDGNPASAWHTQFTGGSPGPPHQIQLDMQSARLITGLRYLPRSNADPSGRIAQYGIDISLNGSTWTAVATGTWPTNTEVAQTVLFTEGSARYVRLRALANLDAAPYSSAAELDILANTLTPGGTLGGTPTRTAGGGVVTFNDLTLSPGGTYALTASSSGLASATSVSVVITSGAPTQLRFTAQPQSVLVGQVLPPVKVRFEDASGPVITTQAISLAIGTNPGGGQLAGTVTRAAVAGEATFNDLAILLQGGTGYTLVASALAVPNTTSNAFSVLGQPAAPREWIAHATHSYRCAETGGDTNSSALADTALVPQANLSLVSVDSQDTGYEGVLAIDGEDLTFWHTQFTGGSPGHPHQIVVNLGASYTVTAFQYLRRQDGDSEFLGGGILAYEFYVNTTGVAPWGTAVASGTMADIMTRQTFQTTPKVGQYVRLVALSEVVGRPYTSMAELTVFGATGVGAGADYTHTLACALPAGDLRAQGLLRTCALLEVGTVGAASTAILALHLGGTVLNTNDGASITQTLTSNSWVCFDTVVGANPGVSVPTYSSYLQTAPSFSRVTGRGGITSQPVTVNTTVAEIAAFASRWLSSTGGNDYITLKTMTMGLSK
jgi:parallel beta-helix repeat protein